VRDVLRAERRDGRLAVWHARCVEPDGERSDRRGVPYAARHAEQSALGEGSPEQDDSWEALRVSKKMSVRREPRVRTRIHDRAVADGR
jgi:hypothetical protein